MNKKEKIIESALLLFAEHGFTETSIDKIARHAGVSKGLTYTHFKNKEDLLEAVIAQSITRMTADMMDLRELTFKELFANFFGSLKKNKDTIRLCLLLLTHPQTPETVNQLLEQQKQELLNLLTHLLSEKFGEQSGMEAKTLLATIDGITLDYVVDPDPENLQSIENYLTHKYS